MEEAVARRLSDLLKPRKQTEHRYESTELSLSQKESKGTKHR